MHSNEIERLFLKNETGSEVELSVKSPLHVNVSKDVSGLSDVEAEVFSTTAINEAGSTFVGYHIESRDITIVGHINALDKDAVRFYRHLLLSVLNPAYNSTLTYKHGEYERVIKCRTSSAPQFEADGVFLRFEIELLALNPYWTDPSEQVTEIASWIGGMEFDEENGLELTNDDNDPQWEIGYRQPSLIANIVNEGDTKTGLEIIFQAQGAVTNPGLRDISTQDYIQVNVVMAAGEEITVKTGYGEKSVTYKRQSGSVENAFRCLDIGSTYLQMAVGGNPYRYYAETGEDNLNVIIRHSNLYLGV